MRSPKALIFTLLSCATAFARTGERTIAWEQVQQAVAHQLLEINLPGAVHLRGVGVGTAGNELVIKVAGSSNTRTYPKGEARIPRNQVTDLTIHVRNPGGHKGSAIGVGVGVAVGAPAAFYLGSKSSGGIAAAVLIVSAVAGWLIGHKFDTPSTEIIHVLPPDRH